MANKSIAIAVCQLVDRAWFCIELTRYLKSTFSINIPESTFVILWSHEIMALDGNVSYSGVARQKILGGKMFDFRRITLFCLEKRLSKHKITIFSKNFGGSWPFCPPWLLLWCGRKNSFERKTLHLTFCTCDFITDRSIESYQEIF